MTFVYLMPDSELAILVVAHSIDLTFGCKQKSIKDSALDLFGLLTEAYQNGSSDLFRPIHSEFPILV